MVVQMRGQQAFWPNTAYFRFWPLSDRRARVGKRPKKTFEFLQSSRCRRYTNTWSALTGNYWTGLSGFGRTRRDERDRRCDRLLRLLGFLHFAVASLMTFGHFSSPVAWIASRTAANLRHIKLIAWLARPGLYASARTADGCSRDRQKLAASRPS